MTPNEQPLDDPLAEALLEIDEDDFLLLKTDPHAYVNTLQIRKEVKKIVESFQRTIIPKLVQAHCDAAIERLGVHLREQMVECLRPVLRQEVLNGISSHLPLPQVIEVRSPRKKRQSIKPPFHSSLPVIIQYASARPNGFPIPLWIHGAKGVGKSEIARQVAEAFGVPFYLIALSPTTTEGKLTGFKNAATGDFVTGLLDEPYTHGGLAFFDEIDIADPGVMVGLNALISGSDYRFPNGKVVKRHPNFFVIAGANTTGSGAAEGYLRRKMDAAFIDRFLKVYVPLDPALESAICGDEHWAKYIQSLRASLAKIGVRNFELSPRATLYGVALLKAGVKPAQVMDLLLTDAGEENAKAVLKDIGIFQPKN